MLSAGYNAILGPCADVNSDPSSPIIGTRSFGEFPERVSDCVKAGVMGAKKAKSISCLKHFPGHGATSGDTHREIPVVDEPLSELFKRDLAPFSAGIKAGCPMVMTSHIRYPQIDPDHPATLSKTILIDVLRKMLGFKGVILSDSMNMGAIRKQYDAAESTLLALQAGVDVIMLAEEHYDHNTGGYLEKQIQSIELVRKAIDSGILSQKDVDEKLLRILSMKYNQMQIRRDRLSGSEYKAYAALEHEIAGDAICLVQKNCWPLPETGPILCVNATPRTSYANMVNSRGIGPNQAKPAYDTLKEKLPQDGTIQFFDYEERDEAAAAMKKAAAILLVTEDYPLPGEDFEKSAQQAYVKKIAKQYPKKVILVGLRSSYELNDYPENVTYICANSSRTCSAAAMADLLLSRGKTKIQGVLPVSTRF
jgi:beta-N-acetylhexosaminidase